MQKNEVLTPEIIESIDNTIRLLKELNPENEQDKKHIAGRIAALEWIKTGSGGKIIVNIPHKDD
ncbi:MAG: hypothetical protein IAC69_02345 [Proteobacteria bacterium]|uniref:Uncharacterized protein n=1 Tax=Candidatus Enterousia avistercoris TaxID=2840788 RepID=A0A9D9GS87_9PROT|nr:hypothetical protein [Candidatus Enterousia avistercoris]